MKLRLQSPAGGACPFLEPSLHSSIADQLAFASLFATDENEPLFAGERLRRDGAPPREPAGYTVSQAISQDQQVKVDGRELAVF